MEWEALKNLMTLKGLKLIKKHGLRNDTSKEIVNMGFDTGVSFRRTDDGICNGSARGLIRLGAMFYC